MGALCGAAGATWLADADAAALAAIGGIAFGATAAGRMAPGVTTGVVITGDATTGGPTVGAAAGMVLGAAFATEWQTPVGRPERLAKSLLRGTLRCRRQTLPELAQFLGLQLRARWVRLERPRARPELLLQEVAFATSGLAALPGTKPSPNEVSRSETNSFRTAGSGSGSRTAGAGLALTGVSVTTGISSTTGAFARGCGRFYNSRNILNRSFLNLDFERRNIVGRKFFNHGLGFGRSFCLRRLSRGLYFGAELI